MTQREKPGITVKELNLAVGLPADAGTLCSGGMIEDFREGWAMEVMNAPGKVAHYFTRDGFGSAEALCKVTASVRWLFGRGNFPCCQRCVRLRDRMQSAARVGARP